MPRKKNDGRGRLGGRKPGTPNKTTSVIREAITKQWKKYYEEGLFEQDLQKLKPNVRVIVMEKYAQYISPKMKTMDIDMDIHDDSAISIEQRLRNLLDPSKDQNN